MMSGRIGGQWFLDVIANLGGAAVTTFTTMNFGTGTAAGSYTAKFDGLLQKIILKVSPQAASSLAQNGYVTLNCNKWQIQTHTMAFNGFGLATAPQLYGGQQGDTIFPPQGDGYLGLPVAPALTILPQIQYAYSPVTPFCVVQGLFQITKGPG